MNHFVGYPIPAKRIYWSRRPIHSLPFTVHASLTTSLRSAKLLGVRTRKPRALGNTLISTGSSSQLGQFVIGYTGRILGSASSTAKGWRTSCGRFVEVFGRFLVRGKERKISHFGRCESPTFSACRSNYHPCRYLVYDSYQVSILVSIVVVSNRVWTLPLLTLSCAIE